MTQWLVYFVCTFESFEIQLHAVERGKILPHRTKASLATEKFGGFYQIVKQFNSRGPTPVEISSFA